MNLHCLTGEMEIIVPANLDELNIKQVADQMFYIDDTTYFFEQDGSRLYEYNMKNNYCHQYVMSKLEMINWGCYAGIYLWERMLYIFTKKAGEIYCFDLEKKKLEKRFQNKDHVFSCSAIRDHLVYLVSGSEVLCYDLRKKCYTKEYDFVEEILWLNTYGNHFYVISKTNRVYECDLEFRVKMEVWRDDKAARVSYGRIVSTKHKLFLIPAYEMDICIIDKEKLEISKANAPSDLKYDETRGWGKYTGFCEDERCIWFANRVSNYLMYIDREMEEVKWIQMRGLSVKERAAYLHREYREKKVYAEHKISLEEFITNLDVLKV